MSKFDKFKDIFKIGSAVGKPFLPGAAGSILDIVNNSIEDKDDPANAAASKALAERVEMLKNATLALHDRIKVLERRAGL